MSLDLCIVFYVWYNRSDAAVAVDSVITHMAWYSTLLTSENIRNLTNPVTNMSGAASPKSIIKLTAMVTIFQRAYNTFEKHTLK